jgi:competence protein ComEA
MLKKFLAALVALFAVAAFAAVDVNKATQAELESVKGIGPSIAVKILDERKRGSFKDWTDFVDRVQGVGEANAAKFSAEGLTVGGAAFKGVAAAPAKKDDKPAAKAAAPATAAAPAMPAAKPAEKAVAAAPAMKADAKPVAAAPAASAATKADAKPAAKADAKPVADEKKAKADKPAASAPAASAAKK